MRARALIREDIERSGWLIMAEALMLELGKQIGRQRTAPRPPPAKTVA